MVEPLRDRLRHAFADPALLRQALTHRSFGTPHNERLEFVGDAVLNCAIALALYERFPQLPEGDLSRARANLVNRDMLAQVARGLDLGREIRLGDGELKSGGADRSSILADALEAIIGAVFVDGGFDAARALVDAVFADVLRAADPATLVKDPKTRLQEWLQARRLPVPEYAVAATSGEAHAQHFTVDCRIASLGIVTRGEGASRRQAEQDAPHARTPRSSRRGRARVADAATPAFRCGHVAIVGRPSVGKSTLLNALVGEKISITSKKPQTTRHRIAGILSSDALQIVFVDTPGFQTRHRSPLNDRLNRTVRDAVSGVDAAIWVVDAARVTAADREAVALVPGEVPVVVALNKIDLVADKSALLPRIADLAALRDFAAIVPVSAERGTDLEVLKRAVGALLPLSPPLYPLDDVTDRDERFLAAEFVREKIFRQLGDEVPYATTVVIDSFQQDGELRRIRATVYVDKVGQRAILLGEGGERMKAIASQARSDMERVFGGRVFLEVWIKVKRGWASDDRQLGRLGY